MFVESNQSGLRYLWETWTIRSWQHLREVDHHVLAMSGVGGQSHLGYVWGKQQSYPGYTAGECLIMYWLPLQEVTNSVLATVRGVWLIMLHLGEVASCVLTTCGGISHLCFVYIFGILRAVV